MGKYKITIEGEGPHHTGGYEDANEGAKSLVVGLKMAGHTISDARFEGAKPPEDINVYVPKDLREPMGDTAAYEKGFEDASTPAPADPPADNGGGDDGKTDPS